ncbi:transcriptional regulator, DeoR family [Exiguobacterium sibiricum 255-15]|uniref:Transcriptional regulator, DeoR family n=1 Tax=Exiguobacterium sibiricum (strain DSM 17290 / CCUG 55495 / CIP 109462 / JCM 13490 / 255-15) TaxID=262543 RepID=B1YL77_EXIS2|nr:helix-turn-helix transcriptional regulator [Exiguobacterium sibiricum]ACB60309.1 transcriptional regulator, DeoR family [Exiguobacterium sibiricum 255-15]
MKLNERQKKILQIVKENGPITGEQIASELSLTRATLRPDLSILTMTGMLEARPRVGYMYVGKKNTSMLHEKLDTLTVGEFMSSAKVIHEGMMVYDAIVHLFLEDVGSLFVVGKDHALVGVLSRKDFLRAAIGNQELDSLPVNIIMTRMPNLTVCEKSETLIGAGMKLIEKQIDSMPVVEQVDGILKVVGRMTKTNMTKVLVALTRDEEL